VQCTTSFLFFSLFLSFLFFFPFFFLIFLPFLFFCFLFPFFSPYRNRGDDNGRSLAGGAGFGGGVLLGVDGGAAARWPRRSEAATADLWPLALPGGGGPVCLLHGGEGRGRHFLAGMPAATCSMAGAAGRREPPAAAAAGRRSIRRGAYWWPSPASATGRRCWPAAGGGRRCTEDERADGRSTRRSGHARRKGPAAGTNEGGEDRHQ